MLHTGRYKPYVQNLQTAVIVHQFTKSHANLSTRGAGKAAVATGAEVGPTGVGDPPRAAGPDQGQDYRHSTAPVCEYCGRAPHNSRQECRALGMECYTCHKFRHLSHMHADKI